MNKIKKFLLLGKSFTAKWAVGVGTVLIAMIAAPDYAKMALDLILPSAWVDEHFQGLTAWVAILKMAGVIKGRADAEGKPILIDR